MALQKKPPRSYSIREVADARVSSSETLSETIQTVNPNQLLSRAEVAQEYGIPAKFLENAAWRGDGPAMIKLGYRTVRYRRADIEAYIQSRSINVGENSDASNNN